MDKILSCHEGHLAMNCLNCGAPLEWSGAQPYIVCAHCSTFRSIGTPDDSADRIVALDAPGKYDCPRCHDLMTQAAMDGLKVEHCECCQGVMLQDHTFAMLVRNRRADYRGAASRPTPLDRDQARIQISCPTCNSDMHTHPYYGPGNVIIDSCARCGTIWLDCGEMAAIETAPGLR